VFTDPTRTSFNAADYVGFNNFVVKPILIGQPNPSLIVNGPATFSSDLYFSGLSGLTGTTALTLDTTTKKLTYNTVSGALAASVTSNTAVPTGFYPIYFNPTTGAFMYLKP
jgi:hypothetical protein